MLNLIIKKLLLILVTLIPILISVAFFTLGDRKIMASIQRRKGPTIVGYFGILQPFADGFKLILKEIVIPRGSNKLIFIFAPWLTLVISLSCWVVIPLNFYIIMADLNLGLLFILALTSMGIYGIMLGGWSSNSKYAIMGAIRSTAQMISYEVALGLTVLPISLLTGSINLHDIILNQNFTWFIYPLLPLCVIYFIAALAETNRAPFDLPEAEAELVAGFNVDYSSILFALFFLGEYSNMILQSVLIVILFLGGWQINIAPIIFFDPLITNNVLYYKNDHIFELLTFIFFSLKIAFICFLFVFVRALYPRFRYE